ncbi:glucosamine-6-phosphate deaminase [Clostridium sp. MCC353]|uniref:glucosamine-6-phosphate deaminase n=1 Tax=Clostridium sp. MCC353 TaxID=2592646 RepID=UPI001C0096AC|nr:glucosamine-6-phosphate deaminase [Clostridium sp. MCC353]MBT9775343.1 glucosamine-6-phosphate deaminase [Clostridium sp. MCC353]
MTERKYGELEVKIFETREELGRKAAEDAAACILDCLKEKETISCIFAAAPSQNEFLKTLAEWKGIPWERINAFHMDEYIGLKQKDSRSFSGFLSRAIFDRAPFRSVNLLDGMAKPEEECGRYSELLEQYPADIVFMGVGENGHIAFNDPGAADFKDPRLVKIVELEELCRRQQVNDGCFETLDQVPERALTVTVPALTAPRHLFCMVPNERKAEAVSRMLNGDIDEACPASILRRKAGAKLYLDEGSASKL